MSREQLLVFVGEQAKQITALRAVNEELATKLARVEHLRPCHDNRVSRG